jgi:hypothetical protein
MVFRVESMLAEVVVLPVGDVGWYHWGTPQAILGTLSAREQKPPWWADAVALVA